jgi:hypothetical protein
VSRRTGARGRYWQRITSLLSQRDRLIDEILLVRSRGHVPSPRLIDKAHALLTRFWARADWESREEVLRTARWLVTLGRTCAPAPASKPKRPGTSVRAGQPHTKRGDLPTDSPGDARWMEPGKPAAPVDTSESRVTAQLPASVRQSTRR